MHGNNNLIRSKNGADSRSSPLNTKARFLSSLCESQIDHPKLIEIERKNVFDIYENIKNFENKGSLTKTPDSVEKGKELANGKASNTANCKPGDPLFKFLNKDIQSEKTICKETDRQCELKQLLEIVDKKMRFLKCKENVLTLELTQTQ
ncbi:unnamed protein product [Gordionus sp. m RMFG-2023]